MGCTATDDGRLIGSMVDPGSSRVRQSTRKVNVWGHADHQHARQDKSDDLAFYAPPGLVTAGTSGPRLTAALRRTICVDPASS